MKKLSGLFLIILSICLAAMLVACSAGEDGNTKFYVPDDDTGKYEEISPAQEPEANIGQPNTEESGEQDITKSGGQQSDKQELSGQSGRQQSSLQRTAEIGKHSISEGDNLEINQTEKPEVGRFDIKSLKLDGTEIKESFEYFYIQLRADGVFIAAFKEKDKKEAYGMSGYRLDGEKIVFDNMLSLALTEISAKYAGEEIILNSSGSRINATFARSDSK